MQDWNYRVEKMSCNIISKKREKKRKKMRFWINFFQKSLKNWKDRQS